jgi:hypothetical protein
VLNRYTIFHYWEAPSFQPNGEHGRRVSIKSDSLFEHAKPQLDRFSHIFDFNNPLSPKHELLARRHNLLQLEIYGEPEIHDYEQYDLATDITILASKLCNMKIPLEGPSIQSILSEAKQNLVNMLIKKFPHRLIHMEEI